MQQQQQQDDRKEKKMVCALDCTAAAVASNTQRDLKVACEWERVYNVTHMSPPSFKAI